MAKRLKWGTIEYLEQLIDEYFEKEPIPTIAGLRVHIGISDDCWKYYINDRWRIHRKTEEEIEEISKRMDESIDNEAFEELMEISSSSSIDDKDDIGNDHIKSLLSTTLKKAKDRIDVFVNKQIFTAKNPAGPIFYAKAALGYRETAPDEGQQAPAPAKITINILPQPAAPVQVIEGVTTTYSVLPAAATPENAENPAKP